MLSHGYSMVHQLRIDSVELFQGVVNVLSLCVPDDHYDIHIIYYLMLIQDTGNCNTFHKLDVRFGRLPMSGLPLLNLRSVCSIGHCVVYVIVLNNQL